MDKKLRREMEELSKSIRVETLREIGALGFGHIGGSLSIVEALSVLYGGQMRVDPANPTDPGRDKLVVSKGHGGPAVYAALALRGFFPKEWLSTLNRGGTRLPSHCDRNKTPGIDATTGSLGQGASEAVGIALADMLSGRSSLTYLILGDGELQEGQVWEAVMFAAARKLSNLIVLVDNNKRQLDGYLDEIQRPFDIAQKFAAFGFDVREADGGDVESIYEAIEQSKLVPDMPHAVILDTIKGQGVADVENTAANHSMTFSLEQAQIWIDELSAKGGGEN